MWSQIPDDQAPTKMLRIVWWVLSLILAILSGVAFVLMILKEHRVELTSPLFLFSICSIFISILQVIIGLKLGWNYSGGVSLILSYDES